MEVQSSTSIMRASAERRLCSPRRPWMRSTERATRMIQPTASASGIAPARTNRAVSVSMRGRRLAPPAARDGWKRPRGPERAALSSVLACPSRATTSRISSAGWRSSRGSTAARSRAPRASSSSSPCGSATRGRSRGPAREGRLPSPPSRPRSSWRRRPPSSIARCSPPPGATSAPSRPRASAPSSATRRAASGATTASTKRGSRARRRRSPASPTSSAPRRRAWPQGAPRGPLARSTRSAWRTGTARPRR